MRSEDYTAFFQQALQQIKSIREPRVSKPDFIDMHWPLVEQQEVFSFGESAFEEQRRVVDLAKQVSLSVLFQIIHALFNQKQYQTEAFSPNSKTISPKQKVVLAVHDYTNSIIYLFHEKPDSPMWKLKGKESQDIEEFLSSRQVSRCIHIYLLLDHAYLLIVGHNNDETDPGRGYNVYSIKWFFETLFGKEEYQRFLAALTQYKEEANKHIGFICVKSLTPYSLINFRRIVEQQVRSFPYDQLMQRPISCWDKEYHLGNEELSILKSQFMIKKYYEILVADNDFSESLITAEWLYDSMKKAEAIDLTAVAMGYFKAVEQLLFAIICLYKNEGLLIKKDFSRQDLPSSTELCDKYIDEKAIDTSIGSMAVFIKDNLGLFRKDLRWPTKYYIRESVFKYKDLRNDHLHKDNIHSWDKINEIRNESYLLLFLLIGSYSFSNDSFTRLGMKEDSIFDDYYYLCEYLNYHSGWIFFTVHNNMENIFIACSDLYSKVVDGKYIEYSGAYFCELGKNGKLLKFDWEHLPEEIYIGKFVFANTELVDCKPVKVRKIFENGRFVGSTISEEEPLAY